MKLYVSNDCINLNLTLIYVRLKQLQRKHFCSTVPKNPFPSDNATHISGSLLSLFFYFHP
jgi:hypothetical protein